MLDYTKLLNTAVKQKVKEIKDLEKQKYTPAEERWVYAEPNGTITDGVLVTYASFAMIPSEFCILDANSWGHKKADEVLERCTDLLNGDPTIMGLPYDAEWVQFTGMKEQQKDKVLMQFESLEHPEKNWWLDEKRVKELGLVKLLDSLRIAASRDMVYFLHEDAVLAGILRVRRLDENAKKNEPKELDKLWQ